jgi:hypothetical protein
MFYGHFVRFMAILYVLWPFGIFPPLLLFCVKKNLATRLFSGNEANFFRRHFGPVFFGSVQELANECTTHNQEQHYPILL